MPHPNRFQINEAWIFFKLNDAPLVTESDGDFNLFALMNAGSCFILSSAPLPATQAEPSNIEVKRLLNEAKAHRQQLPKTLFVAVDQPASLLIGAARAGFKEQFAGGSTQ